MYPGFSGGPLVDVAGRVLGMNSSALSRGASLTVPVSTLLQVVDELRAHGRVRRGYLGVSIQPVQLSPSLAEKLEQTHGLIVMAVHPGAPAEQASLMLGDILIKFGDRPIRRLDDLMAALAEDQVGSRVLLQIVRGGDLIEKEVTIGER
jgi:S1-C subfamily serine protease